MSKPVLAVALLAVMAGAWYWALVPAAPSSLLQRGASRIPAAPTALQVPVVRLDHLAALKAERPAPGTQRNPFRDSPTAPEGPERTPSSTSVPAASAAPPAPAGPAPPAWPRLELIGLAETSRDGGVVRTAIVSGPHGVLHARPGDVLEGVYRLERIGTDGVEVRLLPEDRIIRFPLRR